MANKKIVQVTAEHNWGLRAERTFYSVFIEVDSFTHERETGNLLAWALLLSRPDDPKIATVLKHTIKPHGSYNYPPNLTARVIEPISFTD